MAFKKKILSLFLLLTVLSIGLFTSINVSADGIYLYLGGMPAGFTIKTNGAEVIGISDIVTENGIISPAKNADIKIGDIITTIGKDTVDGAESIAKALSKSNGEPIEITVVRNGETIVKYLTPKADSGGNYKLGVFLREDISGIGTVTYFTKDGYFAALGHPILTDKGDILDLKSGISYSCSIIGCKKGEKGKAGELKGIFIDDTKIGCISLNTPSGIYGKCENSYQFNKYPLLEIGNAQMGNAKILTCIDGINPTEYEINIVKTDANNKENKNYVIKITDKNLTKLTGGIIQGMSGSPIIQNGKLVGAVTHVFVNDPTRGYGINIENMLKSMPCNL